MIVVCGEALMDVFDAGASATGQRLDARIGGSPFNVAIGLARLAQPVAFGGALSRDFLGRRLRRALADEGVDLVGVHEVDAPTSMCLIGLDANGVPAYGFVGERGACRQWPLTALAHVPAAAACHFGSYAMVVAPTADTQRALVERERGRALISYDPNVRLTVEPALERWREVLAWMLPRTQLLKVSEEDLGLLFPGVAPETLAAGWLDAGVRLAVVTRGAEGALGFTRAGRVAIAPVPTALVDTVGAGDTFQAALLAGLAERGRLAATGLDTIGLDEVEALLGFAARAAAITCSRRGADLPRRSEIS
jgi:fructokinase